MASRTLRTDWAARVAAGGASDAGFVPEYMTAPESNAPAPARKPLKPAPPTDEDD